MINVIDINKTVASNTFPFGKQDFKIGYREKNKPLFIFFPEINEADEIECMSFSPETNATDETEFMSFLMKAKEFSEKYNGI